jgi:hypothetical protein
VVAAAAIVEGFLAGDFRRERDAAARAAVFLFGAVLFAARFLEAGDAWRFRLDDFAAGRLPRDCLVVDRPVFRFREEVLLEVRLATVVLRRAGGASRARPTIEKRAAH